MSDFKKWQAQQNRKQAPRAADSDEQEQWAEDEGIVAHAMERVGGYAVEGKHGSLLRALLPAVLGFWARFAYVAGGVWLAAALFQHSFPTLPSWVGWGVGFLPGMALGFYVWGSIGPAAREISRWIAVAVSFIGIGYALWRFI